MNPSEFSSGGFFRLSLKIVIGWMRDIKKASVEGNLPRLFNMSKTIVEYQDDVPNQLDRSYL